MAGLLVIKKIDPEYPDRLIICPCPHSIPWPQIKPGIAAVKQHGGIKLPVCFFPVLFGTAQVIVVIMVVAAGHKKKIRYRDPAALSAAAVANLLTLCRCQIFIFSHWDPVPSFLHP